MSIFGIDKNLMNQILREAEEEEFDIDDSEFTDDEEDSSGESDAKTKAVDDIMNDTDSDESSNEDSNSETSDAKTKAVDDIMNDNEGESTNEPASEDSGETSDNGSDNSESEGEQSTDDGSSEENFDIEETDDSGEGDNSSGDEGSGEGGEDEDFSIDGMDDTDGGEDSGDGATDDSSDSSSDTGDAGSGDVNNELVEKEKELFSNLTEDQMKIKTNELKKSFVTLSDTIEGTSERLSSIPANGPDDKIIKFLVSKLDYLSNMVDDYMTNTFNSKTYIENTIYYQTCLAQLNTIKKVLEEMATKAEKEVNQKDKS